MKLSFNGLSKALQPLKKWVNKLVAGKDDDDNQFNHPYIIF